jgi:hypothetical protein
MISNGKYTIQSIPNISQYITDEQRARWERWIEALESGEYQQTTTGYLKTDHCFCVLGTGVDLFKEDLGGTWSKDSAGDWRFSGSHLTGNVFAIFSTVAPREFKDLLITDFPLKEGDSTSGLFKVTVRSMTNDDTRLDEFGLSSLSDTGFTFKQIAEVMRTAIKPAVTLDSLL